MVYDSIEALQNDVDAVRQHWCDLFQGSLPKPSQFAAWLRLYPIDIIAKGLQAANRWVDKQGGSMGTTRVIYYASACMKNMNQDQILDGGR